MSRTKHRNSTARSFDARSRQRRTGRRIFFRSWALGALLFLGTIIAYQQAWHAGYVWDDDVYVTANKLLTAPDGLWRIWFSLDSPSQYFPLVYSTFRIERALWGLDPAGYHWTNILLHATNALLVWRLLYLLRVPGAWLAAALFALHPVHVESVAWITERKNVLMGFFFLLALLCWLKFLPEQSKGRRKFYFLALLCYALALFSKTTACTLPAALLLILWLKKNPITWRRILEVAPFIILGLVLGLVTIWWEKYHQGTRGEVFALGWLERLLVASRALWFYLSKLLWPTHLSFSYPKWSISTTNPLDYAWLLASAALGGAIYFARRYAGRGLEVAALFFVATLTPTLGLIMLYTFRFSFVADHYQYLASIGPLALAAAGITLASESWKKRNWLLGPITSAVLLLSLSRLTWHQCGAYHDIETLWQETIAENPRSWMAYYNLGTALLGEGRVEEAIAQFNKALELDPNYASAHNNLGNALLQTGRAEESLAHLERAVQIAPRHAEAHNNLGNTLVQMGRSNDAIAHYIEAFRIDPRYAEPHNNLGALFLQLGRVEESFAQLQKALQINPEQADAHSNIGNTLLQMGKSAEAAAEYQRALELRPENVNAQNNLAWLLATSPDAQIRNGAKAVELAERADRISRGVNPVITATLAAAYAEMGRFPDAVRAAERALRLANSSGNTALASGVRHQIELYQSGSPSRENR